MLQWHLWNVIFIYGKTISMATDINTPNTYCTALQLSAICEVLFWISFTVLCLCCNMQMAG